jgi:5-methylcytosine-specific restriction protein A
MPQRAFRQCSKQGCPNLVRGGGYCPTHAYIKRESFKELDKKKTSEEKAFYSSVAWTETSRQHRISEPLCRECKKEGKIVAGTLVHHDPPLAELLTMGESPLDDKFLVTLCFACHQKELFKKRSQ